MSLRSSAQLRPCRDLDLDPRHSQQICLSNTGIEHLLKSFKLFWGYYSNKHLHVPLVCPYMPSSHCTLYYTLNFVIFQSTHETPGPKFCSHVPWKAVATSMLTAQPNKKNSHHPPSKPHLRAQTPSTCTNPTYVHSSNLRSVVLTEIRGCKFFTSDLVATSTRRSSKQDGYQSPSIP